MKSFLNQEIALGFVFGVLTIIFAMQISSYQSENCGQHNSQSNKPPTIENQNPPTLSKIPSSNNQNGAIDKNSDRIPNACGFSGLLSATMDFIDENEGFFVTVFTFFLALSTYRLWRSTEKLWETTRDAGALARDEFIATHRPRLRIQRIRDIVFIRDQQATATVEAVNIGETDASLFEVGFDIFVYGNQFGATPKPANPLQINPGQQADMKVCGGAPLTSDEVDRIKAGKAKLCLLGMIIYRDRAGSARNTSIFRIYSTTYKKFMLAPPEHEYAEWNYEI
jgi:hypothetical protein